MQTQTTQMIQTIQSLIENHIPDTTATVETRDGVHFEATVISKTFEVEKNRIKRQKMVYGAIGHLIDSGEMHAIALKCYAPSQI